MINITSTVKKKIIDSIILFPLFWSFSGNFIYVDGQKHMPIFVFLALIASLSFYGIKTIKENIKNTKLLWLLAASITFAIFAYYNYNYSTRRLRALISLFIYFSVFPQCLIPKINLKHLTILGTITASTYVFSQIYILDLGRAWHRNPLPYATFIASISTLALYFLLQSKTVKSVILWFAVLLPSIVSLFYSQSRGPCLALIIVATILLIKAIMNNSKNTYFLITIALVIVVSSYFSIDKLNRRIAQTQNEIQKIEKGNLETSIGWRLQMWQAAGLIIKQSPLLGVGENHIKLKQELADKGLISQSVVRFKNYHNQYINDTVKYGIIGLLLLLSLILLPIYYFFKNNNAEKWPGFLVVLIFAISALTYVPFKGGDTLNFYLVMIYITLCVPIFNTKQALTSQ